MTDSELISQFLDGDLRAFNVLLRRWQRPLFNFILRYVGDAEEAKDLCQTAFIRVYRNLRRLRDPSRFSTWVYSIAVNLCKDNRKDRRNGFVSIHSAWTNDDGEEMPAPEPVADPEGQPDAEFSRQELAMILQRAMRQLPEEQRVVVILKTYQGLKFTEIAEALGEPLNTVKSRMYYGLHALRRILKEFDLEELSMG